MSKRSRQRQKVVENSQDRNIAGQVGSADLGLWLKAFLIIAAVLWIFYPALRGDWLIDDDLYFTGNSLLNDPWRVWKAWFQPGSFIEYYPIEESIQWVQWRLWGNNTFGYHLTNLLLHIANSLLVWRLFSKIGLRYAWVGGLLFAVHPMVVESVAWISELKNTLSLAPFLLAMGFYIDYDQHRRIWDYRLALTFFLLAMLCKISMAPFPLVILLYAWWKRGRVAASDLNASAPFFLISLALGVTTIVAGEIYAGANHGQAPFVPLGGLASKLALAGLSLSFYFSQCVFPISVSFTYPQWKVEPPGLVDFLPWLFIGASIYFVLKQRRNWGRHALLGLGFFLAFLAPFVGLQEASYMDFTWVMDHFVYISIVGLIGLIVGTLDDLLDRMPAPARPYSMGMVGILLGLLTAESHLRAGTFINGETLWRDTLKHVPQSWVAYNNIGCALLNANRLTEAEVMFEKALAFNSDYAAAHDNLGNTFFKMQHYPDAIREFQQTLKETPDYSRGHSDMAAALIKEGRFSEAIGQLHQALALSPDYPSAHHNLGDALVQTGHVQEGIDEFKESIRLYPFHSETHYCLARALLQTGHLTDALGEFQVAVGLDPSFSLAYYDYGNALLQAGHLPEAIDQFRRAILLYPPYVDAHINLGTALVQSGHPADALKEYQTVVALNPNLAEVHNNIGTTLVELGRGEEGRAEYEKALKLDPQNVDAKNNLARLHDLVKAAQN